MAQDDCKCSTTASKPQIGPAQRTEANLTSQVDTNVLVVAALRDGERPCELLVEALKKKYPEKVWLVEDGDLVTFEHAGVSIQNPFMSENWLDEVDPSTYGIAIDDARAQRSLNLYGKLATVACIARLFSYEVSTRLSEFQLAAVRKLNRDEKLEYVCHTHDFCDANLLMDAAFVKCGLVEDNDVDVIGEHLQPVWNAAWDVAKVAEFQVDRLPPFSSDQKGLLLEIAGEDFDEPNLDTAFDAWVKLR
ncbi:hypothetical protein WT83_27835 [Burkholderia territorii]|uniref:Uncharacterized protein n=1 Tax=Burkholderia territorii TaxID=1503055 RepID=A0A119VE04_9BURK|nr:hypothetical protein [Burkholderia territorii]KWN05896.1 hypothetical protein WT83_27835 [Burkholderia territorii]